MSPQEVTYARRLERSELVRLMLLGLVVVLESLAVLSVVLHTQLFPSGSIYPNIISVAVFVLPALVGLLARRIETAVLLAVLPFWLMGRSSISRSTRPSGTLISSRWACW